MAPLQWLQVIAALASGLAACLVWAMRSPAGAAGADILAAKDAELAALKRELDALRELGPVRMREFFLTTRRQLKDFCALLAEGYEGARRELGRCETELARLRDTGAMASEAFRTLTLRREELAAAVTAMKPGLRELQHQSDYPDPVTLKLPTVNPAAIRALTDQGLALAGPSEDLAALGKSLAATFKYRLDEYTLFSSVEYALEDGPNEPVEVWQRPDNGE